jgi:hypothetical protein
MKIVVIGSSGHLGEAFAQASCLYPNVGKVSLTPTYREGFCNSILSID